MAAASTSPEAVAGRIVKALPKALRDEAEVKVAGKSKEAAIKVRGVTVAIVRNAGYTATRFPNDDPARIAEAIKAIAPEPKAKADDDG